MMDTGTVQNRVSFQNKNVEKLVNLVGSIIRKKAYELLW